MVNPIVSYEIDPGGIFQTALNDAASKVSDLTIPFTLITREWYQGNKAIFALKGPGKYPPLGGMNPNSLVKGKAYTHRQQAEARKKSKFGFDYPLLFATGRLAASLTMPGGESIANIVDKRELDLGTRVEYGIYHQSTKPRKTLPFRPFLFIGAEQLAPPGIANARQDAWVKILENHVRQAWDGDL